ncbi:hypothetical protein G6F46_012492 [Rhizopus delemar]|uniref:Uncharacterized protein n=2 Tax=Rhizopus TaxID=4842 RepID=A0A9P6YRF0_9FUNG|nr:hypothetical protein G6F55_012259 [Rhizopus delemar]KAG1533471.1 hypothetical protein G6F51_012595 [Rhizopus arrhizus]KAG1489566.1 hypothetical protein G6F54_011342 [Rhizopus delemar]KAG1495479.1 hypothetical protein G6F53_012366 [Rhizopus delemar]KAG1538525.1 hypothetical protein G6F49_012558 [Rhizopus delemar]
MKLTLISRNQKIVTQRSLLAALLKSPRAPNWSKGDDIKLCEAWVSTSEDPIRGSDQKYEALWERILQDFKAREPERQRNASNLEAR